MKKIIALLVLLTSFLSGFALEERFKQGCELSYSSINTMGIEKGLSLYKRKQVIFFRNDTAYVVATTSNSDLDPFWTATELESLPVDDQFAYDDYRDEIIFTSLGKLFQSYWKDAQWTYQKRVKMEGVTKSLPKDYDISTGDPRTIKKIYHTTLANGGDRMYFSAVSKGRTDLDIWYSERGADDVWRAPHRLTINTDANEEHPFVVGDSLLYFSSNRAENRRSNLYYVDLRQPVMKAQMSVLSQPNTDEIGIVVVDNHVHVISDRCKERLNQTCDDNIFKCELPDRKIESQSFSFKAIPEVIPVDTAIEAMPVVFRPMTAAESDSTMKRNEANELAERMRTDSILRAALASRNENMTAIKVSNNVASTDNKVIFYFDLADDQLAKIYDDDLNALYEFIQKHDKDQFLIAGYTDVRGTDEFNNDLSVRRAQGVFEQLVAKGVDQNRLMFTGFGKRKSGLVIKNAKTEDEHQKNRRVEIVRIKK